MEILSRTISDRTATLISEITSGISLPINYIHSSERPGGDRNIAGSVDAYGNGGSYSVWLNTTLPQEPFEADILHELHHIVQILKGYPSVFNKSNAEFQSTTRPFIEKVGSGIASTVLDIDVNNWLNRQGYSYSFFTDGNYRAVLDAANYKYPDWRDPLNFASLVHALLQSSLYVDDTAATELFNAYSEYPELIRAAANIRTQILLLGVQTPIDAAYGQGIIIDTLDLWKYYRISSSEIRIRTHNEFVLFSSQHTGELSLAQSERDGN